MSRFKVAPSRIDGRGLYATESLPARKKLGELAGERIRQREAERRARHKRRISIVEFGDGWAIDATVNGNEFRFVNHSCDPNAFIRLAFGRVEFYARRRINAGEEITCNYGETQHEGTLRCRCGVAKCRESL